MKYKMHKTKFKQTEIGMIPEEWEVGQLGNLCEITSSKRIFLKEYVSNGIPFYRSKEIILLANNQIISDTLFISKERFEEISNKFGSPKEGDLLMTSVGTLGVPYIVKKNETFYFKDGNLMWFRSFKPKLKNKFLYYWIKSPIGQQQLDFISIGSTQRALTIDSVKRMKISFPKIGEQEFIAKILSDLDSKIELNQQMNKTLEEIGKAIFKHWFVDFEFPNEEGKPYKSSGGETVYNEELGKEIPKGWRVGRLGDGILTSISKPGIDNFVGEKIYLDTASVQNTDIISLNDYITFDKRPSRANMQPKIGSVWFAKMKDSKKGLFFDDYSTFGLDNFILSTGFLGLSVKSSALYYIWNIISSDEFERQKSNLCNGTTMQAINNVTVQSIKALVPDEKVLIKFNEAVKSLYNRIYINFVESQILSQIRDLLLPKLMSGKIRVPLEGKE